VPLGASPDLRRCSCFSRRLSRKELYQPAVATAPPTSAPESTPAVSPSSVSPQLRQSVRVAVFTGGPVIFLSHWSHRMEPR